ncbi:MAG: hypothetical protein ACXAD7_26825 [Candidatus Kariarchaeaceae archaeon]|jgi:hypothetical protein
MSSFETEAIKDQKCLICTWDEKAECTTCDVKGKLDCKWNQNLLLRFYKGGLPAMLFGGIGFVIVGLMVNWIPLFIYIAFWIFFFGFFEIRILCSHCPYYAEDGFILHCLANHGTIKVWKYHPEPMNVYEKIGFLAGALFFVLFPVITEVIGIYVIFDNIQSIGIEIIVLIALSLLSFLSGIYFFVFLQRNICPYCVNFSCPLNKVAKELVDSYLTKNPIMREAWEASGYRIVNK